MTSRYDYGSKGESSLNRSASIHRKIVSASVALTVLGGVALAKLHPGITASKANSNPASTSASSGLTSESGSSLAPSASSLAPLTASGGS